jgi:Zn-dependent protease with chaperone function
MSYKSREASNLMNATTYNNRLGRLTAAFFLALVLLPVCAQAAVPPTPKNPYEFSFRVDCSKIIPAEAKAGALWLRFSDKTKSRDKIRFAQLGIPACRAAYGAMVEAGKHASRIQLMHFILVDNILGVVEQAAFDDDPKPQVEVTVAMLKLPKEALLWVLGHELAHARFNHPLRNLNAEQAALRKMALTSGAAALYGGYKVVTGKSVMAKVTGAAIAAGGLVTGKEQFCDITRFSIASEIQADEFGVKVLQRLGYDLENAKGSALAEINRHQEQPEGSCGTENAHPSSIDRETAISKIKR